MIGVTSHTGLKIGLTMQIPVIAATGNLMVLNGMAGLAGEIQTFRIHVYVNFEAGIDHVCINVTMLDLCASTTHEVESAARTKIFSQSWYLSGSERPGD